MFSIKYLRLPCISTITHCRNAVTKTATGPSSAALKLGGGVASTLKTYNFVFCFLFNYISYFCY